MLDANILTLMTTSTLETKCSMPPNEILEMEICRGTAVDEG